ncbi:Superoxide dismutase, related [Neospora caninum Liverpool]|uniref:Superoxide dismutase n=1 Tax=Neospora caninum (strain Liverpool) TaxID=572307 RepID=F0VP02_NEOCL|nr:Superoxide dismutase, related [Neospora caninum Liverpool]CBZ55448.1 Superoxide dismutase, related [Neospora caninum Liverpool]CEL70183.1 TPA: Superoxide dismutase, related [Neospora caninum Liverpool]|eukprot:XP_003885476.1 Superoxide dismutase, related [Neospora caninum Liverpool]
MSFLFSSGTFECPPLPYDYNALEPYISSTSLKYHHDYHHEGYVKTLNKLVKGTEFENKSLEDIIRSSSGTLFNNAAQAWNHTFFWNSMKPNGGGDPTGLVKDEIDRCFSSFSNFKEEFTDVASKHFGSGWAWLVWCNEKRRLEVMDTHDAGNPITKRKWPILTCDLWEHGYYLDTQNDRGKYIKAWWSVVNWDFANMKLEKAMRGEPIEEAVGGGQ